MKKNAGFTLVEMVVVVAIIAVLAAVAVPAYMSYIPKYRLNSASQELQGDTQMAKLQAVKNGVVVTIGFNVAGDTYEMFYDDGAGANAGNGIKNDDEQGIKTVAMPQGINITGTTFPNNAIRFNSRGLPVSFTAGTVTMQNQNGQTRILSLDTAGSASIAQS